MTLIEKTGRSAPAPIIDNAEPPVSSHRIVGDPLAASADAIRFDFSSHDRTNCDME